MLDYNAVLDYKQIIQRNLISEVSCHMPYKEHGIMYYNAMACQYHLNMNLIFLIFLFFSTLQEKSQQLHLILLTYI